MTAAEARSYPTTAQVGDREVGLRLMTPADGPAIVAFARALPPHDLLFLRRDITREDEVAHWIENIREGHATSILAEADGGIAGYATIDRSTLTWSQHVGELRVLVAEGWRGKGLGRVLTQEAFANALTQGIEKMVAQMTLDQKGAIAVFEGLGFRPEALLRDHVKDRAGTTHDLLMLSHDVSKFGAQLAAYGVSDALGS